MPAKHLLQWVIRQTINGAWERGRHLWLRGIGACNAGGRGPAWLLMMSCSSWQTLSRTTLSSASARDTRCVRTSCMPGLWSYQKMASVVYIEVSEVASIFNSGSRCAFSFDQKVVHLHKDIACFLTSRGPQGREGGHEPQCTLHMSVALEITGHKLKDWLFGIPVSTDGTLPSY